MLWPYPQLLLAAHPQGPVGNPDCLADFWDVKRLIRTFLYHPAKSAHDQLMLPLRHAVLPSFALAEAANHRLYELLLQPMCGNRIGDDFRSVFR
jgi:hypothetical protein